MGFMSRIKALVSPRRGSAEARRQEALGHLEAATALFLEAGERAEAARLYALRAGSALDSASRLLLLAQAAENATGDARRELLVRRAGLLVELTRAGALEFGASELRRLGAELEATGEHGVAADLYRLAGDDEAEASALVAAGAVERLEQVLDQRALAERRERELRGRARRVQDLFEAGRRREALALGSPLTEHADVAALVGRIERDRVSGPCAWLVVGGDALEVVFGDSVSIGRAEATLAVASPAVSRRHLVIRRGSAGPEVLDAGSHNGTTLSGVRLAAPLAVGQGLALVLGGEVEVRVRPWERGVVIELGQRTVHAPLGPLEVGAWQVAPASDAWLELVSREPAYFGVLRAESRVELCRGDALSREPGGPAALEVRR